MMVAQIVDQLTHGHMLGHRHKLALHDTASGFFGVGQRVFDDSAVFGVQLGKNGLLVLFLHILDDRDRVICIQLSSKPSNLCCGQGVNDILADIVIDLGQHFGAHQLAHADGKVTAPLRRRQLEQIGNVGFVERFNQPVDFLGVARFHGVQHAVDIFAGQTVVFVQRLQNFRVDGQWVGDIACHVRASHS